MTDNIITTKRELADYLKEHDPEMLEFFIAAAKEFGPAETVAYITSAKFNAATPPTTSRKATGHRPPGGVAAPDE